MMKYRKSALVAISFILFFSISLFLYSCGQNNPGGVSSKSVAVTPPAAFGTTANGAYYVYVANSLSHNIGIINPSTGLMSATFSTGGSHPVSIAINPNLNKVYVVNSMSNNVSVFDLTTNAFITNVSVGFSPINLAIDPNTNKIYVLNGGGSGGTTCTVSVIDPKTNTASKTVNVGSVGGICINPATHKAYITSHGLFSGQVYVLDTNTDTLLPPITIPSGGNPFGIVIAQAASRAYVTMTNSDEVGIIDTSNDSYVGAIPITLGKTKTGVIAAVPYSIAIHSGSNKAYVINKLSNTVSLLDLTKGSEIKALPVGSISGAVMTYSNNLIAIDTTTNRAYISNTNSNNITVIDTTTDTVISPAIATGINPAGLAMVLPFFNLPPASTTPPPPPNASNPSQLASIRVWTASPSVAAGELSQFNAQGINNDGTIDPAVTSTTVVWSLSNNLIAGVDTKGLVTTKSQGNETVTATYQGLTGSAPLNSRKPELSKIDITPLDTSIKQYNIVQYSASGTFTDKTVKDITNEVRWNSNDTTIAQITNMYPFLNLIPNGFLYQNAIGAFAIIGAEGSSTNITAASTTATGKLIQASATVTVSGGHYRQNITLTQENTLKAAYQANPNTWMNASEVVKIRSSIWWEGDPYGNNWDANGNDLGPRYVDPAATSPILPQILVQTGTHNPNLYWYGCHTVSAAMVATKATKQRIDPRLMNNYLHGNNGYTYPNNGPVWFQIKAYAGSAIVAYTNEIPIEDASMGISAIGSYAAIDNALQNNKMVIIKVHGQGSSFISHYVVVAGGSGGNYTIYDPWIRTGEKQEQITNMNVHYHFAPDATYNVITIQ